MNYHYPSEAPFGYTNLRSITGQAPGYLHPIAYATARFVASTNKGDATPTSYISTLKIQKSLLKLEHLWSFLPEAHMKSKAAMETAIS